MTVPIRYIDAGSKTRSIRVFPTKINKLIGTMLSNCTSSKQAPHPDEIKEEFELRILGDENIDLAKKLLDENGINYKIEKILSIPD